MAEGQEDYGSSVTANPDASGTLSAKREWKCYARVLGVSSGSPIHTESCRPLSRKDDSPLLVSLKDGSASTARRLTNFLKKLFSDATEVLPPASEHKREKLRKAFGALGRHIGITAKVNVGWRRGYVHKDARHADSRTTSLYFHEEEDRWHDEARKQRLPWARG